MCAQDKSQRASHEIFSKLISTFSAFIHLDCESPKVPLFCGSWHVRFTIRTLWHKLPPFKVIGKITIYHFHDAFASKSHALLAIRARCNRILAIDSVLYFSQSHYFHNSVSLLRVQWAIVNNKHSLASYLRRRLRQRARPVGIYAQLGASPRARVVTSAKSNDTRLMNSFLASDFSLSRHIQEWV